MHDKDSIFQKLIDEATRDPCCGQNEVIERKATIVPQSEVMVHAMVTNILVYGKSYKASEEAAPLSIGALKWINGAAQWNETSRKRSKGRKRRALRIKVEDTL